MRLETARSIREEFSTLRGYVQCPLCEGSGDFRGEVCPECGGEREMPQWRAERVDLSEHRRVSLMFFILTSCTANSVWRIFRMHTRGRRCRVGGEFLDRSERLERAVGIEPTQCQVGSLVPFRLATPAQEWSREWELNPRPRDYRSRALPTELSLDTSVQTGAGCRSRTRVACL
jgi:hypothetical protein